MSGLFFSIIVEDYLHKLRMTRRFLISSENRFKELLEQIQHNVDDVRTVYKDEKESNK